MASYKSINPYNQEEYLSFETHSNQELEHFLKAGDQLNTLDPEFSLENRIQSVGKLAKVLLENQEFWAKAISKEMGKVITEAHSEIEKCAWLCEYYAEHASNFLADQEVDLGDAKAIRSYRPLGLLLGIMPWNFPFWQVFRFAVPSILAGNRVLVKHAPNCPHSAELIQEAFTQCFPSSAYQNIRLTNEQVASLLKDQRIKGLSLTGSTQAGKTVASLAAAQLKPQLLELGGSNAFVLFPDADPIKSAKLASAARLMNAGQSCIAAKRFIVPESIIDEFEQELNRVFKTYRTGDPLDSNKDLGPLARPDLAEKVADQIERAIEAGAELILGGGRDNNFIEPTILKLNSKDNPVFNEEVFGPVAALISYKTLEEAVSLSNHNPFGLGVSLIGKNVEEILKWQDRFEEGAVFINELVKSDPRLPFGGVNSSGYGRELGPEGVRAFCNLKTIYIKANV